MTDRDFLNALMTVYQARHEEHMQNLRSQFLMEQAAREAAQQIRENYMNFLKSLPPEQVPEFTRQVPLAADWEKRYAEAVAQGKFVPRHALPSEAERVTLLTGLLPTAGMPEEQTREIATEIGNIFKKWGLKGLADPNLWVSIGRTMQTEQSLKQTASAADVLSGLTDILTRQGATAPEAIKLAVSLMPAQARRALAPVPGAGAPAPTGAPAPATTVTPAPALTATPPPASAPAGAPALRGLLRSPTSAEVKGVGVPEEEVEAPPPVPLSELTPPAETTATPTTPPLPTRPEEPGFEAAVEAWRARHLHEKERELREKLASDLAGLVASGDVYASDVPAIVEAVTSGKPERLKDVRISPKAEAQLRALQAQRENLEAETERTRAEIGYRAEEIQQRWKQLEYEGRRVAIDAALARLKERELELQRIAVTAQAESDRANAKRQLAEIENIKKTLQNPQTAPYQLHDARVKAQAEYNDASKQEMEASDAVIAAQLRMQKVEREKGRQSQEYKQAAEAYKVAVAEHNNAKRRADTAYAHLGYLDFTLNVMSEASADYLKKLGVTLPPPGGQTGKETKGGTSKASAPTQGGAVQTGGLTLSPQEQQLIQAWRNMPKHWRSRMAKSLGIK